MNTSCPWWARWWHRRLRSADERMLFSAIGIVGQGRRLREREMRRAIEAHMAGSAHWCCPCALDHRKGELW